MKTNKHNHIKDAMDTMNESEASYHLTIWIGAIFYFLLDFGKEPFEFYSDKKFTRKNLWTGYCIIIFPVFIVFICMILSA